jgi:divalent metal cation (Fe/Co/Zn/Cd) transporter
MRTASLYRLAFILALITIVYNIVEGLFSTYFGFEDESLALFGFGMDSFIEVISGIGIAHMVLRIQKQPDGDRDAIEKTALRITGSAFYLLVVGLVLSSVYNIWIGHQPLTTAWGVFISSISIITMWILVYYKRKVGRELNSAPLLADANCTLVCIYMSIILLISSGLYELFGLMYVDSLGSLGLAYYAYKEGRECFFKAKSNVHCSCD